MNLSAARLAPDVNHAANDRPLQPAQLPAATAQ